MPVRIATVTNHQLLREGLLRILSAEPSFTPLHDFIEVPVAAGASDCDIVLIDSQIDGALLRCARLKAKNGPAVIFVGVYEAYDWCMQALRAGARGLVSTRVTADMLIRAIHSVHQGGMWVPEHIMAASIERVAAVSIMRPDDGVLERLSTREAEVFRHAATGLSNKDLAELLHITEATVKVHLTNIFAKLGLRGRAELAAAYHGILHNTVAAAR